jgi:hypothetical protein
MASVNGGVCGINVRPQLFLDFDTGRDQIG